MEDNLDATYAPRSPDLSGPVLDEPHPQHRQYRGSVSHIGPFTPTEPKSPFFSASALHQPHQPPPPQHSPFYSNNNNNNNNNHNTSYSSFLHNTSPQQHQTMKHEEEFREDEDYQPEAKQRPVSRSKKVKTEHSDAGNGSIANNAPGVAEGIEVRTKFPVARIKRIMQADEDVGKVAQVTPVAVSKALELFMISLVTKAASEARARGSKRVTSAHLKQAVQKEEQFDFLSEIVSKVPDAPAPRAKDEDSDEPMDGVGKKKRGASRKKRKESDEF